MRRLAIYDMDKTITRAPTWTPFLLRSAARHAPWRLVLVPLVAAAMLGYALGLYDRGTLKSAMQRMMLGGTISPARLRIIAEEFADHVAHKGVFQDARARIEADRAAGYTLVLATASFRYYAEAIGERLGFDAVIATGSARRADGALQPRIDGENCYGPVKLRMIEAWLAEQGLDRRDLHVRFYSDHVSDAPVLGWADEPFAVNAHGPLRRLASARGWPILDWES